MADTLKKLTIVCMQIICALSLFSATAQAGGWFKETPTDTVGEGYWRDYNTESTTVTPHLDFSTVSNKCRTCHAVHLAGADSWRLLKDGSLDETRTFGELSGETGMGNKRATECMYCHDADSGASSLKPYGVLFGKTIRGQHSLGATWIPDSSANDSATPEDGRGVLSRRSPNEVTGVLDCYQCHSVHGSNILTEITAFGWGKENERIDNYILRDDPAGNGYYRGLSPNVDGINAVYPPPGGWKDGRSKDSSSYPEKDAVPYNPQSIWKFEVQAAFCGDCHNMNPSITGPGDFRPNLKSHPTFGGDTTVPIDPFNGGVMEVYGTTQQVSGGAPKGCEHCHMSGQQMGSQLASSWPHQAEGVKFLVRSETATPMSFLPVEEGSKSGPGDSFRVIPRMDKACLWCHRFMGGGAGVGVTF